MMEEVETEEHEVTEAMSEAKIRDELQEAALTNVTQRINSQSAHDTSSERKSPSPQATKAMETSASRLPPPSALPPQLTSLTPGGLTSVEGATAIGGSAPPTAGFIPSPGVVSATPTKPYQAVSASVTTPMANIMTPQAMPDSPDMHTPGYGTPMTAGSPYNPSIYGTPAAAQSPASPPGSLQSPYEASASIQVSGGEDMGSMGPVYPAPGQPQHESGGRGLFGWFSGGTLVHKVMEKTKSSVETMITTLDPGMKEVIYSGGDVDIVVTSTKDVKLGAVRDAFQQVFGKATVTGKESQPSIAPQPVGYTAGLKGAEERIDNMRRSGAVHELQVIVSVESFIAEILPDNWYDVGCLVLKDPANNIELQTFSQATALPLDYIQMAQDETPADYNLRWSGLAITVGQIIQRVLPHVDHADWHQSFTGVSRREILYLAAKSLAGMYKERLKSVQH